MREGGRVHTHDRIRRPRTPIRHQRTLHKDILLKCIAPIILHRHLDLLHDQHDRCLLVPLAAEVRFAEEVIEVVVEAVVLLVDDQDLVDLLHDLLLELVVLDLQAVLPDLDDLRLLVEAVEAVDEGEGLAAEALHGGGVAFAQGILRERLGCVDWLCGFGIVSVPTHYDYALVEKGTVSPHSHHALEGGARYSPAKPVASANVNKVLIPILPFDTIKPFKKPR